MQQDMSVTMASADDLCAAVTAIITDPKIRALADLKIRLAEVIWNESVPDDWAGFLAFAERAGVARRGRYDAAARWGRLRVEPDEPDSAPARQRGTALYRLYDAEGALLYVGVTDDLPTRMRIHSEKYWWSEVARKTVAWYDDRDDAEQAETLAIAAEKPRYNRAKVYAPREAAEF